MPYFSDRPRGSSPFFIVIHTGEGILDRQGMANFLANNPDASAHAASDAGGVVAPLVPYSRAAWTAGPTANNYGLHVELCAFACMTRDQWLSEADVDVWVPWLNANRRIRSPLSMLRNTAAWVRDRCQEFGITIRKVTAADLLADRDGICGHADTSAAWHETDHTDPGGNFPWPEFIALVNGNATPVAGGQDDMTPEEHKMLEELQFGTANVRGIGRVGKVIADTGSAVQAIQAQLAGLTAAVAALSKDSNLTVDQVREIVTTAVKDNVKITGTVEITGAGQ